LLSVVQTARAWFLDKWQYIGKWLAIGLVIGAATCAASFGLGYLLSYLGVAGAAAAVGAVGTRNIGGLISAIIFGPLQAWSRWMNQSQLKAPLGELPSLSLVNVTSTVALLPIGKFPYGLGVVSTFLDGTSLILPVIAALTPSFLNTLKLDGRRWIFVTVACMLLKSVITICCFGAVRAGIFLLVNIPTFIMFFVSYYLDKQSGSFIPSVCASVGTSVASLVASFLL
jgi:hypothetical protein